ncbi:MAG: hypothetical protein ACTHNU_13620 [Gaiellales bacterium]
MRVPRATLLALTGRGTEAADDPDSWRTSCEGFQVWSPSGRVGTVSGVQPGPSLRDGSLLVVGGLFRRRSLVVPFDLVAEVQPDRKRLILSSDPPHPPDVVSAANAVPKPPPTAQRGAPL